MNEDKLTQILREGPDSDSKFENDDPVGAYFLSRENFIDGKFLKKNVNKFGDKFQEKDKVLFFYNVSNGFQPVLVSTVGTIESGLGLDRENADEVWYNIRDKRGVMHPQIKPRFVFRHITPVRPYGGSKKHYRKTKCKKSKVKKYMKKRKSIRYRQ
jgi:hypothetical protein